MPENRCVCGCTQANHAGFGTGYCCVCECQQYREKPAPIDNLMIDRPFAPPLDA